MIFVIVRAVYIVTVNKLNVGVRKQGCSSFPELSIHYRVKLYTSILFLFVESNVSLSLRNCFKQTPLTYASDL
jgi:hypothetical protein